MLGLWVGDHSPCWPREQCCCCCCCSCTMCQDLMLFWTSLCLSFLFVDSGGPQRKFKTAHQGLMKLWWYSKKFQLWVHRRKTSACGKNDFHRVFYSVCFRAHALFLIYRSAQTLNHPFKQKHLINTCPKRYVPLCDVYNVLTLFYFGCDYTTQTLRFNIPTKRFLIQHSSFQY